MPDALQSSAIRFGLIPGVFNGVYSLPPEYQTVPDALTLLTYAFLHGDIWHLLGNMVFLWVFADNVEDALGHLRFLLFYCLSAIGAGYVHVLATPASDAPVIGASGAVAGVVAGYVLLHPFAKVWILAVGRTPAATRLAMGHRLLGTIPGLRSIRRRRRAKPPGGPISAGSSSVPVWCWYCGAAVFPCSAATPARNGILKASVLTTPRPAE